MARIVVAMSGGVDSSAAAARLKQDGHDVVGLFLRNGISKGSVTNGGVSQGGMAPTGSTAQPAGLACTTPSHKQGCCSLDDSRDAAAVAAVLGVPFYVVDYAGEFGSIIEYFIDAYKKGSTPNPCVVCNRDLKFGSLLQFADSIGAESVATGHYARIVRDSCGRRRLARGVDGAKDQSYVLAAMEPKALDRSLFPLGHMEKPAVRELARAAGLPVFNKRESQEICFVPSNNYRDLFSERGIAGTPGNIVMEDGTVLGRHEGYEYFTIGQRKGIGISHDERLYVKSIRPADAAVVVAPKSQIETHQIECSRAVWFTGDRPPAGGRGRSLMIQVRAHHSPVRGFVRESPGGGVHAEFERPEPAIAPGQLAVFYDGDLVEGSGWITSTT